MHTLRGEWTRGAAWLKCWINHINSELFFYFFPSSSSSNVCVHFVFSIFQFLAWSDDGVASCLPLLLAHFGHVQLFGWLIFFRSFLYLFALCCCLSKKLNIIQRKKYTKPSNKTMDRDRTKMKEEKSYGTDTEQAWILLIMYEHIMPGIYMV